MIPSVLESMRDRSIVDRIVRRIKKKVLTKPGFEYYTWRYVANARPTILALRNPPLEKGIEGYSQTLAKDGIVVASTNEMLSKQGLNAVPEISDEIYRLNATVDTNVEDGNRKDYLNRVIKEDQPLDVNHPIVRVALDQKLLEIVAAYMGFWPRLSSVAGWVNYPTVNTTPRDAQLWHRDPEDIRICKMFTYVSDVDDETGPFTYIPGTQALGRNAPATVKYENNARTTDEDVIRDFPSETWIKCTGAAGTMILADTRGYHRGGRVQKRRRLLFNATYVSNHPYSKLQHKITGNPNWTLSKIQNFAWRGAA